MAMALSLEWICEVFAILLIRCVSMGFEPSLMLSAVVFDMRTCLSVSRVWTGRAARVM